MLRKLLKKEERRQARSRREGLGGGGGEDDPIAELIAQGFDPKELRRQRYVSVFGHCFKT